MLHTSILTPMHSLKGAEAQQNWDGYEMEVDTGLERGGGDLEAYEEEQADMLNPPSDDFANDINLQSSKSLPQLTQKGGRFSHKTILYWHICI